MKTPSLHVYFVRFRDARGRVFLGEWHGPWRSEREAVEHARAYAPQLARGHTVEVIRYVADAEPVLRMGAGDETKSTQPATRAERK